MDEYYRDDEKRVVWVRYFGPLYCAQTDFFRVFCVFWVIKKKKEENI